MISKKLIQLKKEMSLHFPTLKKEYHVKSMGIFGSMARGEERKGSDIDIMVDFTQPIGFFEFIKLEKKLQRIFHKKVDLVSKKALKPAVKKEALKEAIYL